jgi:hypothetical protein
MTLPTYSTHVIYALGTIISCGRVFDVKTLWVESRLVVPLVSHMSTGPMLLLFSSLFPVLTVYACGFSCYHLAVIIVYLHSLLEHP